MYSQSHGVRAIPEPPPNTGILYQNRSRTVILIDIPTSIAQAQTASGCRSFDALLSCEPIRQPYPSTEPKSEAARTRVLQQADPKVLGVHSLLRQQIQDALAEIRTAHKGDWCLPRHRSHLKVRDPKLQQGKSVSPPTTLCPASVESAGGGSSQPESGMCGETASHPLGALQPPLQLRSAGDTISMEHVGMPSIYNRVVRNENSTSITFDIDPMYQLRIPPLSTFISSPIENSIATFVNAANKLLCKESLLGSGQFDLILADPPWTNRSVRRSKKYKTLEHQYTDPWETIRGVLGKHLAPGGLVGIWITNKAEPREKVLAAFQHWNVQLVEEWVWIKTTLHGELVTELDGIWRRPYEILLLGRKSYGSSSPSLTAESSTISRRFICGVPDLHSRKPSLKELLEPLMPDRCSYQALELFARNLTAGWWSWGDEVFKFNWEDNWVKDGLRSTLQD
jgi:N6-adenosine-specific RNA methylase IME4